MMDLGLVFLGCHRRGGVERSMWEMARFFASRHDVTVYAAEIDGAGLAGVNQVVVEVPDGPRYRFPRRFSLAARAQLQRAQHDHVLSFGVAEIDADVLWVNSVHRAWIEQSTGLMRGGLRSSSLRRWLPHHRMLLAMERDYFRAPSVQHVVTVSDIVANDINRLYGVPRSLTTTIHNGFDPAEFAPLEEGDRRQVRAELGLADDDIALVITANELHRKGLATLLEAVAMVGDRRLRVVLAGRTPPTAYARQIERLGLTDQFRYLGTRTDMGQILGASDLFVLPTQYEAFCLAIVEALASGLPVVTTTVPGAADLIADGSNGRLLTDPRDAAGLAEILREAADGEQRAKWASAAAPSVADHTWQRLFERAEALLADLPSRR